MEKKDSKKTTSRSKTNKRIKILWGIFIGGVSSIILLFMLIAAGIIGYMPPIADLENPIDKYASQVYSSDNELLGTFSQSKENRIYSSYEDLSPYLVQALVATEDARYYEHSGIDFEAFGRVLVKTIFMGQENAGGGSTISQQLAKLLYTEDRAANLVERAKQKLVEWVIAVRLERSYTKDEIINLYLNKFDFLNNAVGIKSAAKIYFNKLPKDLTIEESAMLIGMCKNPSIYNPVSKKRFDDTRKRRNTVLEQMEKANYITADQLVSLKEKPLKLNYQRVDHKDGVAPYFREYLRMAMTAKKPIKSNYSASQLEKYKNDSLAWATDPMYGWCAKNKKPDGSYYNLYSDGLRIHTTIDSRMQTYAEEAMREHVGNFLQPMFEREKKGRSYAPFSYTVAKQADSLIARSMRSTERYKSLKKEGLDDKAIKAIFRKPVEMKVFSWRGEVDTIMTPWDSIRYHKSFLRSGFAAIDPYNGHVKAYVGGIDFKFFQYDMVNLGRRQIGSTIKPFLYAQSMIDGMTPCDELLHVQPEIPLGGGRIWRPKNPAIRVGDMVSIKWGLQVSSNWVTAWLMTRSSPHAFVNLLHSFGITGDIDPQLSLALGTCDVSVGEMVSAYTAFVNKGIRSKSIYVTRIEDAHGNVIANFSPDMSEVFDEITYVKMLDLLKGVVDAGTGRRVRTYGLRGPMGGKTGTTQNNSDGWFMGFTPELVAGCWVGGEDRSIHFDYTSMGQGAVMALPVFGLFMKKVYADPKLGYSPTKNFIKIAGNPSPCANQLGNDDESDGGASSGGVDDMFK